VRPRRRRPRRHGLPGVRVIAATSNVLLPSVAEHLFAAAKLVDFGSAIAADCNQSGCLRLTNRETRGCADLRPRATPPQRM
jgi:hypothetical protein